MRSPRWTGIRSETVDVCGTSVHYLRADAGRTAPPGASTHLLVHPLAAGGTFMLDLIGPLTTYGPVVTPDLPGSIFGYTGTPGARAATVEANAQFLRAFTSTLGLDSVVTHGWSMGAAVALRFAAASPDRVERLVLANPPLPAPLTRPQWLGWQTLGRLTMLVGPILARALVRLWGGWAIDKKLAVLEQAAPSRFDMLGGDPSRIAAENLLLWAEQLGELRSHPDRMGYAATAFLSVASGIFVDRRRSMATIDRVAAPVLLLWGDQDPLIERPTTFVVCASLAGGWAIGFNLACC